MAPVHAFYPLSPIGTAKSWHVKDTNDLLSEKLLDGYSLLADTFCPQCVTPLLRRKAHTMIGSFKAMPVAGVAFCVSCNEHVVANDSDNFKRCNSLKEKGETSSLDSLLDSLQKCSQRRQNMIDAFEEDREDLIFSGVLECPSEERIKTGARENAEQAKPAIDAMEKDTKPFLEVIPPFKKQLTPTIQLDPSTNDAQRKAKKEELEYERKKSLPQSSTTGVEKGSADSARRDLVNQVFKSKILEGYSSMVETQCLKCGMPLMRQAGQIDCAVCVVCPVLAKKLIEEMKEKILTEKEVIIKPKAAEQGAVASAKTQEEQAEKEQKAHAVAMIDVEDDGAAEMALEEKPLRQPNGEEEMDTSVLKSTIDSRLSPSSVASAHMHGETSQIMHPSAVTAPAFTPMPADEALVSLPDEEESEVRLADDVEGIERSVRQLIPEQVAAKPEAEAAAKIDDEEDEAVKKAPEETPLRQPNDKGETDTFVSKKSIDAPRSRSSMIAASACDETTLNMPPSQETGPAITAMPVDDPLVSPPDEEEPRTALTITSMPADEALVSLPYEEESEITLADNVEVTERSFRQHIPEQMAAKPEAEAAAKIDVREGEAVEKAPEETPLSQLNDEGDIDTFVSKKSIDAPRSPSSVIAASACGENTHRVSPSPETAPAIMAMPADNPLVSPRDEEEPNSVPAITSLLADEALVSLLNEEESEVTLADYMEGIECSLRQHFPEQVAAKPEAVAAAKTDVEEDEAVEKAPEETPLRQPNDKGEIDTFVSKMSIDAPRSPSSVTAASACGETTLNMPPSPETGPAITAMPVDDPLVSPLDEKEPKTAPAISSMPADEEESEVTLADYVEGIERRLRQHTPEQMAAKPEAEAAAKIDVREDEAVEKAPEETPLRQSNGEGEIDTFVSKKSIDAPRSRSSMIAASACGETTHRVSPSPETTAAITAMLADDPLFSPPNEEVPRIAPAITPMPADEALVFLPNEEESEVTLADYVEGIERRLRQHTPEQMAAKPEAEAAAKIDVREDEAVEKAPEETPLRQSNGEGEIDTLALEKSSDAPRSPSSVIAASACGETTHKVSPSPETAPAITAMPADDPLISPPDEEEPRTAPAITPTPADEAVVLLRNDKESEVTLADYVEGIEHTLRQHTPEQMAAKPEAEAAAKIDVEEDEAVEKAPEETPLRQPNDKGEIDTFVSKMSIDAPRSPSSVTAASACGETTLNMPPSPETGPAITAMPVDDPLVSPPDEEEPRTAAAITPTPAEGAVVSLPSEKESEVSLADYVEGIEHTLRQHTPEQMAAKPEAEAAAKIDVREDEAVEKAPEETPPRQPNGKGEIDTFVSKKSIDAPRSRSSVIAASACGETTHKVSPSPETTVAITDMLADDPLVLPLNEEEPRTAPAITPMPADEALVSPPNEEVSNGTLADYVEGIERRLRQHTPEQMAAKPEAEAAARMDGKEDEAVEKAPEETPLRQPNGEGEIDAHRSPSPVIAASACGETTHKVCASPETTPAITAMPADEPLVSPPDEEEPEVMLADDVEGIELSLSQHICNMKILGETAARIAILPARPVDCYLWDLMEDEDQGESTFESHEALQEYSIRREIASNLYGSNILQGFSLLDEAPCLKCGMPLMKNCGKIDCVVCPVLVKKRKEEEEERKVAEQKAKLEAEAAAQKKAEGEAAAFAKLEEEKAKLEAAEAIAHEEDAAKSRASDEKAAAKAAAGEVARRKEAEQAAMQADAEENAAKMIQDKMRAMLVAKTTEKFAARLVEAEAFRMEEEARLAEEEWLLEKALITEQSGVTEVASDGNRLSTDEICSFMSSLH